VCFLKVDQEEQLIKSPQLMMGRITEKKWTFQKVKTLKIDFIKAKAPFLKK